MMKKRTVIIFANEGMSRKIRGLHQMSLKEGCVGEKSFEWKQIFTSTIFKKIIKDKSDISRIRSVCQQIKNRVFQNLWPSFLFVLIYSGEYGSFSAHGRNQSYLIVPSACLGEEKSLYRNIFHEILHGVIHRCASWPSVSPRLLNLGCLLPKQIGYSGEQLGEEYLVQMMSGWEFKEIQKKIRKFSHNPGYVDEKYILGSLRNLERAVCI